ncbi:Nitrite transporter NirC [Escherichia coli]|nr:Nitrite transporter NirC [Escherichia coli]
MFTDTINKCAANAARIARLSANNPLGFWVSSAMAGAYVGLGIILIFTLGNLLDPSVRPLVMGATFGIALTLVIIAGSELFTGHHVPHLWGKSGQHQPRANVGNPAANLAG